MAKEANELTTTGLRVPRAVLISDLIAGLVNAVVVFLLQVGLDVYKKRLQRPDLETNESVTQRRNGGVIL